MSNPESANGIVANRVDFLLLYDVQDGNPNGDPDAGNSPRIDPETSQGLVSDVCLKRKVRDYVLRKHGEESAGYNVFVQHGHSLYSQQEKAFKDLKLKPEESSKDKVENARRWMCKNFYDVRAFGAVMSTKQFNCGQVRGPVQVTFSRSVDPIFPTEHGITRVAFTQESKQASTAGSTEMGRKHTIPYGLYVARGFVTPHFARPCEDGGTGFTSQDLELLWEAVTNMFEIDRSAARGAMAARRLYVFEHDNALGRCPAQKLFGLIERRLRRKPDVDVARHFEDYQTLPSAAELQAEVPEGVTVSEKIEG